MGASEGWAAEQHVLQHISLLGTRRKTRRAPLVRALLARRRGETADSVYLLKPEVNKTQKLSPTRCLAVTNILHVILK